MSKINFYCSFFSILLIALTITLANSYITVYEDAEFQGIMRTLPHFKACLNLVNAWQDRITSINTHGNCIMLCEHKNCKGRCEKFEPGTWRHNHLGAFDFNDKASSFKSC